MSVPAAEGQARAPRSIDDLLSDIDSLRQESSSFNGRVFEQLGIQRPVFEPAAALDFEADPPPWHPAKQPARDPDAEHRQFLLFNKRIRNGLKMLTDPAKPCDITRLFDLGPDPKTPPRDRSRNYWLNLRMAELVFGQGLGKPAGNIWNHVPKHSNEYEYWPMGSVYFEGFDSRFDLMGKLSKMHKTVDGVIERQGLLLCRESAAKFVPSPDSILEHGPNNVCFRWLTVFGITHGFHHEASLSVWPGEQIHAEIITHYQDFNRDGKFADGRPKDAPLQPLRIKLDHLFQAA